MRDNECDHGLFGPCVRCTDERARRLAAYQRGYRAGLEAAAEAASTYYTGLCAKIIRALPIPDKEPTSR